MKELSSLLLGYIYRLNPFTPRLFAIISCDAEFTKSFEELLYISLIMGYNV